MIRPFSLAASTLSRLTVIGCLSFQPFKPVSKMILSLCICIGMGMVFSSSRESWRLRVIGGLIVRVMACCFMLPSLLVEFFASLAEARTRFLLCVVCFLNSIHNFLVETADGHQVVASLKCRFLEALNPKLLSRRHEVLEVQRLDPKTKQGIVRNCRLATLWHLLFEVSLLLPDCDCIEHGLSSGQKLVVGLGLGGWCQHLFLGML